MQSRPLELTPLAKRRSIRIAAVVLTALLLALALAEAWGALHTALNLGFDPRGFDIGIYIERTQSWLHGHGFYLPRQLTGQPYEIKDGDALYPPPAVLLFLPWALGAPLFLWWLIPLGALGLVLFKLRPSVYAWPLLAATLIYPRTQGVLILGNPSMWAFAAAAAGLSWGWPAVGLLLKPALWPLTAIGVRRPGHRRRFLLALLIVLAVSCAFLPMWGEYWEVLSTARTSRDATYPLGELPIALSLLAALWHRRPDARRGQDRAAPSDEPRLVAGGV